MSILLCSMKEGILPLISTPEFSCYSKNNFAIV